MAGVTGLEPATSGVTGRRSNQLSYTPVSTAAFQRRRSDAVDIEADFPRQAGRVTWAAWLVDILIGSLPALYFWVNRLFTRFSKTVHSHPYFASTLSENWNRFREGTMNRSVQMPNGAHVPVLGQGTWKMAESPKLRAQEIASLRRGLELGMTLIDTAEMYGEGEAEILVGEAIAGQRDEVFLVSKVYPHNASQTGVVAACERGLRRLGTDRLDMYLLHWREDIPLEETLMGFEALQAAGKIRMWGVSNFDVADMDDLAEAGGQACATNQVLYNVTRRGPEFDLFPMLQAQAVPVMAYSPLEQAILPKGGALESIARKHDASVFQVALAWVMHRPDVIAIPKTSHVAHVEANVRALEIRLDADDLAAIDATFPPPNRKRPLEMI